MKYDYKIPKNISALTKTGNTLSRNNITAIIINDDGFSVRNKEDETVGSIPLDNLDSWIVLGDS